jgi:hypothetical protein
MVFRWTLYDPATTLTATFAMNPNAGGSPARKKTLTYQSTAAAGGRTLAFQGRQEPQVLELSGTLLTEAEYSFLEDAFDVQNQMLLTDDLGRAYWVVITEFSPTRVRAASHPWKHTYVLRALIVDVP